MQRIIPNQINETGNFDNVNCKECYDYYDCNLANELLSKLKNK